MPTSSQRPVIRNQSSDVATITPRTIRIGTRGSALALAQAHLVAGLLGDVGHPAELVIIRTQGDADRVSPLAVIGGQGVFTSALQAALRRDEIDLAVHSAKDLPSTEPDDLTLTAFLSRQDPRDVLISKDGRDLDGLPAGAMVGTSSRRRVAQLRTVRPDLAVVDLRGNIDTRIRRATEGDLDAVILAAAGLHRMGWQDRISAYLPLDRFVPAPGQAALALEVRSSDGDMRTWVGRLDEPDVSRCVRAERAFLRTLGTGCTTPIGAHARIAAGGAVELQAMIASTDLTDAHWRTVRLHRTNEEGQAGDVARSVMAEVRATRRERRARSHHPVSPPPTVLVTRPEPQASALADALSAAGFPSYVAPMLVVTPDGQDETRSTLTRVSAASVDWVVFASVNAVDGVLAGLGDGDSMADALGGIRVAAVGGATAGGLATAGVAADLVPERSDASGLVDSLQREGISGRHVWLPQGNLARPELADGLRAAGARVSTTTSYRVDAPADLSPDVRAAIVQGAIDALTFASPSAATHLVELIGLDADALAEIPAVCIGETTAARVRELGLTVGAVADEPSDAGFIAAIRSLFAPPESTPPSGELQ